MAATQPNVLSDGRQMTAMGGPATQLRMFNLLRRSKPEVEDIAKVKDADDALNVSGIYGSIIGDRWIRTDEYGLYHKDPAARLGKEIVWVEDGIRYKKIIPDVPVQFDGKEISLQNVVGMGIYPSTRLLKIEPTDKNEFTVSAAVDLSALAGLVRAMNFMRNGWAEPDEYGFPDGNKPGSSDTARHGWVRTTFDKKATGWHGSMVRDLGDQDCDLRRVVYAYDFWSGASGVALVSGMQTDAAARLIGQTK